jgi:hypothetical protein
MGLPPCGSRETPRPSRGSRGRDRRDTGRAMARYSTPGRAGSNGASAEASKETAPPGGNHSRSRAGVVVPLHSRSRAGVVVREWSSLSHCLRHLPARCDLPACRAGHAKRIPASGAGPRRPCHDWGDFFLFFLRRGLAREVSFLKPSSPPITSSGCVGSFKTLKN